jgi:hypothetical protein
MVNFFERDDFFFCYELYKFKEELLNNDRAISQKL